MAELHAGRGPVQRRRTRGRRRVLALVHADAKQGRGDTTDARVRRRAVRPRGAEGVEDDEIKVFGATIY